MHNALRPLTLLLLAPAPLLAQSTLHDLTGSFGDSWGQVADTVGDTDGDGFAEVMVGAWRYDAPGLLDAGAVFVYDGVTGLVSRTIPGTGAGDHMGYGSSAAGDVNNDGFADICAAADEDDVPFVGSDAGSATIISGLDGSVIWQWEGDSGGDLFGWSTAAVGDVDGDGRPDVLVGALLDEGTGTPFNAGSITAYSGATGAVIHRIYGSVSNGRLGSNVGRAGDVNGDGHADLIAVQGSLARVFSGLDASQLWSFSLAGGGSLKVAGSDVNGDGYSDPIVGAPDLAGGNGQVWVYSGFDGSVLHTFTGDNPGDDLGTGVAGPGDLNGDGYGDVVAGMPGFDGGGAGSGGLRAYSGIDGSVLFTIAGGGVGHQIGWDVGGGDDVDLDGFGDVIGSSTSARAKVASFTPQGLEPFGTGTAGCAGEQSLLANAVPIVGLGSFELLSSNSAPLTPAAMVVGDTADPVGITLLGALLHVPLPPASGFALIKTTPPADANGSLSVPLPIPADPGLSGMTFSAQIGTVWTSGPCSGTFSSSRGLNLTVQ